MKCDICKEEMFKEKRYLYFAPGDKGVWIICRSCDRMISCVKNRRRKRWVHPAIERLETYLQYISDERLSAALRQDIERRRYRIGMHTTHL